MLGLVLSRFAPICILFLGGLLLVKATPLFSYDGFRADTEKLQNALAILATRQVSNNDNDNNTKSPRGLFSAQLENPKEMMSILLLIGGDVIQRAVAQLTGPRRQWFTPLVFSFGWVTYAFSTVLNAVGDGTFLPPPDFDTGYVVNVGSGDQRMNQSWILGRLGRDLEFAVERRIRKDAAYGAKSLETGLIVTVLQARSAEAEGYKSCHPCRDNLWWSFIPFLALQLGIAMVPWLTKGNWSVFLVAAVGNVLAVMSGSLRSMRHEKYACNRHSDQVYALTRGNGHQHVFVLLPDTFLKEFRDEGTGTVSRPVSNLPRIDQLASAIHKADLGTRIMTVFMSLMWIIFLLVVGGLDQDTWYLLGAGFCGMIHNILCSGWERSNEAHGIPLRICETYGLNDGRRRGVQEVLVQMESVYPGVGHSLRRLFLNGYETQKDQDMWKGRIHDRQLYNEERVSQHTVMERFKNWKKHCHDSGNVGPIEHGSGPESNNEPVVSMDDGIALRKLSSRIPRSQTAGEHMSRDHSGQSGRVYTW